MSMRDNEVRLSGNLLGRFLTGVAFTVISPFKFQVVQD